MSAGRYFAALAICASLTAASHSQPHSLWSRSFGGGGYDEGSYVQQTADGGFVIVGRTESFGAGNSDVWLIRTAANGDSLWSRTFGGGGYESGFYVQEMADSGFVVIGYSSLETNGGAWLIRTDADGDSLWSRTYGSDLYENVHAAQQTADGGFVIVGVQYWTDDDSASDPWLVKTDADGEFLWSRSYHVGPYGEGLSVQQTSDGGFVITGKSQSESSVLLIGTDADGDRLWSRTFSWGWGGNDWGSCVQETSDGGFIIAGVAGFPDVGVSGDFWLIRTAAEGDSLWSRTFGGGGMEIANSLRQTVDGDFVIAGFTTSFGAGGADVWLIRTDAEGNSLWSQTFGGGGRETASCLQQTAGGGYVIVGSKGTPADVLLIETAMDDLKWLSLPDVEFAEGCSLKAALDYFYDFISPAIRVDTLLTFEVINNRHVAAMIANDTLTITARPGWFGQESLILFVTEYQNQDNFDFTELRVTVTPLFARNSSPVQPAGFALEQAYPNPFNSSTIIRFSAGGSEVTELAVYDLSGRLVADLLTGGNAYPPHSKLQTPNSELSSVVWNAEGLAAGIYLIRLEAGGNIAVRKALFLR